MSTSAIYNVYLSEVDKNDKILKEVWSRKEKKNKFSNLTAQESSDGCEAIYESMGAEAYGRCYKAGLTVSSSRDKKVYEKYKQALLSGSTDSFEEFKKKSGLLATATNLAGVYGSLKETFGFGSSKEDSTYIPPSPTPEKKSPVPYIIGGVLVVGVIGAIIYFRNKK